MRTAWLYALTGFAIVVGICVRIAASEFADDSRGFWMNFVTEGLGVTVGAMSTVLVIDRMNERRDRERLKARQIREAGSRSNDIAISAVEWLRAEKWLIGEKGVLKGAKLIEANLSNANLRHANLKEADLWRAKLHRADLWSTELQGASLIEAELQNAKLFGAVLHDADMRAANLKGADLSGADLRGTDLSDANISNAILSRAYLEKAKLHVVNLQEADLERADLKRAGLFGVNLQDAKLFRANLKKARLRNVNLERANLSGAFMEGATVSLSEAPVVTFLHEPQGDPGKTRQSLHLPPTQLRGATLPDGTTFPENPSKLDALERFTNRDHPEFHKTLEKIYEIRRAWEDVD